MPSRSTASSACQGNKLYEAGVGSSQKVRDPAQGRVPRKLHTATYPLVTTGGGALPLPTPVPQPATLRRASVAAIAKAIFFMGSPLSHDRGSLAYNPVLTSAERAHLHEIRRDGASRQITAAPLGRWRRGRRSRRATATVVAIPRNHAASSRMGYALADREMRGVEQVKSACEQRLGHKARFFVSHFDSRKELEPL
jgi:hypothetical protein